MKNMAETDVVKDVLEDTKAIYNFLKINRINSIRKEAISQGKIEDTTVVKNTVNTRMLTHHIHMESVCKQEKFLRTIKTNPKFIQFMDSQTPTKCEEYDKLL